MKIKKKEQIKEKLVGRSFILCEESERKQASFKERLKNDKW